MGQAGFAHRHHLPGVEGKSRRVTGHMQLTAGDNPGNIARVGGRGVSYLDAAPIGHRLFIHPADLFRALLGIR
ncbi:hypothetical protein SDC9_157139 [bioreactor metagenome]|uniref:Uncharacterized protein n=1 Tax=bioreactor metagenome TaxID=1076179 RepID=A0A645F6P0_9ZZZZ